MPPTRRVAVGLRRGANEGWDFPQAQKTFQQAAALAQTLYARGAREPGARLLARAALGFGQRAFIMADASLLAVLEEALALLGEEDSQLRARVLSRLAAALYYSPQAAERRVRWAVRRWTWRGGWGTRRPWRRSSLVVAGCCGSRSISLNGWRYQEK